MHDFNTDHTQADNRLLIYKASAGSGKTYTLTQEYMRHLLKPGASVSRILAITFTNAATADMKRKILETLAQIAEGGYPDWKKLLSRHQRQQYQQGPEQADAIEAELQAQARLKLRQILHQYQDFSVKTIDSFVQNLIRPFAFELGLPQNYTPTIELNQLSQEITERLLDECGRPGKENQTEILNQFLQKRDEEEKSLQLNEIIQNTVQLLFDEGSFEALESLKSIHAEDFKNIIGKIQGYCQQAENQVEEILNQGKRIVSLAGLTAEDFHEKSKGLYAWFNPESASGSTPPLAIASPSSSILKCVTKGILKSKGRQNDAEALQQCFEALTQLDFSHYALLKEVLNNTIYSLALLERANEILEDIKETTGDIPLSEFNQRIDKALAEENNDFIYERCGIRYHHICIDEFQDTSKLQWKNLRPLVENNLAQGHECLIVGDPKQSIYRFRNANLAQFVNLCEHKGGLEVEVRDLQSNWRSEAGIIAFNNLFYEFIKNQYPFCPDFGENENTKTPGTADTQNDAHEPALPENLAQRVFKAHEQYHKNHTERLPEPDFNAVRIYLAKKMKGEYLQDWYLRHTLEIVHQHQPGKVAILCQHNAHCRLVADYLVSHGIPVSTPDSLTLGSHDGLRLLIASLRYIDRQEEYYKAEAYHLAKQLGLWPGTEADIFKEWASSDTRQRFKALQQIGWQQADVYDTVEAVLRFWKMQESADQFLLTFLDQVQEGRFGRLSDLTDWWTEGGSDTTVCPPPDGQTVRIMSIHKSKGLEFPVVIMPFISNSRLHTSELHWLPTGYMPESIGLPTALVRYVNALNGSPAEKDKQTEKQMIEIDDLNALYVATTRPCQRLYLLDTVPEKNSNTFKPTDAIARFAELYPDYVELEEDGGELLPQEENGDLQNVLPSPGFPCDTEGVRTDKDNGIKAKEELPSLNGLSRFTSTDWRFQAQATALPPSILSQEQEWGNFIHKTLSRILAYTEESLEQALKTSLNEYPMFRERAEEARSALQQLLTHPRLASYFAEGCQVKTEMPIALSPARTYVPDRVVLQDKGAVVLDFKTGEAMSQYKKQVREYMNALNAMGFEPCRGILIYIGDTIHIEEINGLESDSSSIKNC